MAIYTKRGDKGKTSLFDEGSAQKIRVSKNSLKVNAIGSLDELNSFLGICISLSESPKVTSPLEEVQDNLLRIGSILAGSRLMFSVREVKKLEKAIDQMEGTLPILKNFVFPGGGVVSAHLQYARALSRRSERTIVALSTSTTLSVERIKPEILAYLNRLSDYLFMLARKANHDAGVLEKVWKPARNR